VRLSFKNKADGRKEQLIRKQPFTVANIFSIKAQLEPCTHTKGGADAVVYRLWD